MEKDKDKTRIPVASPVCYADSTELRKEFLSYPPTPVASGVRCQPCRRYVIAGKHEA